MKCLSKIFLESRGQGYRCVCEGRHGSNNDHRGLLKICGKRTGKPLLEGGDVFWWDCGKTTVKVAIIKNRRTVDLDGVAVTDWVWEKMPDCVYGGDKKMCKLLLRTEGRVIWQPFDRFCKENGIRFGSRRGVQ